MCGRTIGITGLAISGQINRGLHGILVCASCAKSSFGAPDVVTLVFARTPYSAETQPYLFRVESVQIMCWRGYCNIRFLSCENGLFSNAPKEHAFAWEPSCTECLLSRQGRALEACKPRTDNDAPYSLLGKLELWGQLSESYLNWHSSSTL